MEAGVIWETGVVGELEKASWKLMKLNEGWKKAIFNFSLFFSVHDIEQSFHASCKRRDFETRKYSRKKRKIALGSLN